MPATLHDPVRVVGEAPATLIRATTRLVCVHGPLDVCPALRSCIALEWRERADSAHARGCDALFRCLDVRDQRTSVWSAIAGSKITYSFDTGSITSQVPENPAGM